MLLKQVQLDRYHGAVAESQRPWSMCAVCLGEHQLLLVLELPVISCYTGLFMLWV